MGRHSRPFLRACRYSSSAILTTSENVLSWRSASSSTPSRSQAGSLTATRTIGSGLCLGTTSTPYALVKLRRYCWWTRIRLSVGDSHTLVGLSCLPCCCWSVVLALLASVPWTLVLGTLIRYHKRLPLVNPLAKLFFSPTAYHEIATLSPRTQIDPYSNSTPCHPPPRMTAG